MTSSPVAFVLIGSVIYKSLSIMASWSFSRLSPTRPSWYLQECCAGGGTRTHTPRREPDFESGASTDSATPARWEARIIPRTVSTLVLRNTLRYPVAEHRSEREGARSLGRFGSARSAPLPVAGSPIMDPDVAVPWYGRNLITPFGDADVADPSRCGRLCSFTLRGWHA
jgi:hypothetical protein